MAYLELMAEWCWEERVEIWAYCLMPNHVHLIAVPKSEEGLRRAIGEAHRRYTCRINVRKGWRGHLWQGRFDSFVMDKPFLLAAACRIERNPVRARLVRAARYWHFSSARAHLSGEDDDLVTVEPLLEMASDWRGLLRSPLSEEEIEELRRHERTGRPLGDNRFLGRLERKLDRPLKPKKRGPKPKGRKKKKKK